MCFLIKYQTRPGHALGAPGELRGPSTPLCLPGRLEAWVQLLELRPARGWGPVLVDHGDIESGQTQASPPEAPGGDRSTDRQCHLV